MGTSPTNLLEHAELRDASMTEFTVSDVPSGSYYVAVSVYDSDGRESGFSVVKLIHIS